MAPEESLADRLRALKEAEAAGPEALERARQSKASLAERMREMLRQQGETVPAPPEHVSLPPQPEADAAGAVRAIVQKYAARPPVAPAPSAGGGTGGGAGGGAGLADRLRQAREAAPSAVPVPDERRRLVRWFLGRESQVAGEGSVTAIPEVDASRYAELRFIPLEEPFSFVRLLQDRRSGERLYEVIEPQLGPKEAQVLEFVQDALVRGLNADPGTLRASERESYLLDAVREIIRDYRIRLDTVQQARVEYFLRRDFLGLGPIHALMMDPGIEDISCDGAGEGLFVFHREFESVQTNVRFPSDAALDAFVIRLAQRSGKAISISDPILDAALPDGSRLQATLGREVTQNGSTFTIRRFQADPFTPLDLVRFGTMSLEMLAWFWIIVEHGASLIFSGGTASGKTTGLNAISQFIPHGAKVVSIEDTREVNLPHKNWIKAVTRAGSSVEGTGEIGMFELLKASLRQRPEYILVGEVRGIEATVAFQAMATGHTVYSTMHADSARSVVYRLENDPINIPRLVLQALDVIAIQVQARVGGRRVRRVKEVVELVGMDPSTKELLTNTIFRWDSAADRFERSQRSYILEQVAEERSWTPQKMAQELRRRTEVLGWMAGRARYVEEVTELVLAYERHPEAFVEAMGSAGTGGGTAGTAKATGAVA